MFIYTMNEPYKSFCASIIMYKYRFYSLYAGILLFGEFKIAKIQFGIQSKKKKKTNCKLTRNAWIS